jgi:hypothetical protein
MNMQGSPAEIQNPSTLESHRLPHDSPTACHRPAVSFHHLRLTAFSTNNSGRVLKMLFFTFYFFFVLVGKHLYWHTLQSLMESEDSMHCPQKSANNPDSCHPTALLASYFNITLSFTTVSCMSYRGCAKVQAVSHRLRAVETRVRSRDNLRRLWWTKW